MQRLLASSNEADNERQCFQSFRKKYVERIPHYLHNNIHGRTGGIGAGDRGQGVGSGSGMCKYFL